MQLIAALVVIAASTSSAFAVPPCDEQRAIWANDRDGIRYVVYGRDGIQNGHSDIFFENWQGNRLAWRVRGSVDCSNGVSICSLTIADNSEDGGSDPEDAVVETIDDDGDGVSEYVIFASLSQNLYYSKGLKSVEWLNGFKPEDAEQLILPNVYKFLGCRKTKEIDLTPR
ncbi:hypothetical protein O9X98_06575 [Agrobacterium salinitolerans]|nr:hypothetical protein [Agrobacterium salinitolerans]